MRAERQLVDRVGQVECGLMISIPIVNRDASGARARRFSRLRGCARPTCAASSSSPRASSAPTTPRPRWRDPVRARRRRRGHRFDAGRPERLELPRGARHPDRRDARRGARAAEPPRRAADRHRADRRPAARRRGATVILAAIAAGPRRPVRPAHVPRRRPGVRRGRRGARRPRSSTTGGRRSGWRRPSGGATRPASG